MKHTGERTENKDSAKFSPWEHSSLIRDELFGPERLEEHGASLALAQTLAKRTDNFPSAEHALANRLKNNEKVVLKAYQSIAAVTEEDKNLTPAAEWLLDNYHIVEEQIREIHDDLPPGYYKQLPKVADGYLKGYPRVLGIAWAFVAHTDSRFDPEMLRRFLLAYQEKSPLSIGELWAVAITLRILLVENLRRAADYITCGHESRQQADALAASLLASPDYSKPLDKLIQAFNRASLPKTFTVQLVQRLRDQDPQLMPALQWLEEYFGRRSSSLEDIVREEHRLQGSTNITVRNIITSMRLISSLDWTEFFERVSLVDDLLGRESKFKLMDFPTRNLYRSAIEELAQCSEQSELEITKLALDLAANSSQELGQRTKDPGYYLISAGRAGLEKQIDFKPQLRRLFVRLVAASGIYGYLGAVFVLSALVLGAGALLLFSFGLALWQLLLVLVLGSLPVFDLVLAFINQILTKTLKATLLPSLSLSEGVPENLKTMVVIPTMLTSLDGVKAQLRALEIHHLASQDGHLHFALVTDWLDAPTESLPTDQILLEAAQSGVAELNALYGSTGTSPLFLIFQRKRRWSVGENCWMGWERKRGKLHELNQLLRGDTKTSFLAMEGVCAQFLAKIKFIITLDNDTRLPMEAARRLIGKLAHPLNRALHDPRTGKVLDGYALLQPRVSYSLLSGQESSLFQRVFSSVGGVDPYAAAVSDVYQDLYCEGSYAGKGIYDIDAFELALKGKVPENSLLSHDLFEGIFARAGLVSDIEVVEEFPARYDESSLRQHRWTRGDWQLLPWIFGRDSGLSPLGAWKMLDNLRRSLLAPFCLFALLLGFTFSFWPAVCWTIFILLALAVPVFLPVFVVLFRGKNKITIFSQFRSFGEDLLHASQQLLLSVAFLAYQAHSMLDAILRTFWRLFVSRRKMLEWVTAAIAKDRPELSLFGFYKLMGLAVLPAALLALFAVLSGPDFRVWLLGAPFILLWLLSPAIAFWVSFSRSTITEASKLSMAERATLRSIARKTWRFFESFVTEQDNWLPPDNFQEDPRPVIARRTSPTNIGLYLLATASAYDFGWTSLLETSERLEATLGTMESMELYRGHFYNWYATADLRPLEPRYISSVDSGNLAGHLLTLANSCKEWREALESKSPSFDRNKRPLEGLNDNLSLTREALLALPKHRLSSSVQQQELLFALQSIESLLSPAEDLSAEGPVNIALLLAEISTMTDMARAFVADRYDIASLELLFWAEASLGAIQSQCLDENRNAESQLDLAAHLLSLERRARNLTLQMEFGFLLNPSRKLLSIGYLVNEDALDESCYDLLASEARLASFIAIAKGDIPAKHWFRLGRSVVPIHLGSALISWSGSMFEYLMPSLVMRTPIGSLIEQTNRLVVEQQIVYARKLNLPWGVSESAYNVRDKEMTYQYSNFGLPGLGLKRGLGQDAVIAPYATGLACLVDPKAALRNFSHLASLGALSTYGFYEALDFTRSRLPEGKSFVLVRSYMAHHQGMTLLSLANTLLECLYPNRFHSEPMVEAAEFLLEERKPRDIVLSVPRAQEVAAIKELVPPLVRKVRSVGCATPETQIFSNGRYSLMLTNAGSGYSAWNDLAITRWQEDVTQDNCGNYHFIRDLQSGEFWSAAYQPTGREASNYEITFNEDRAEFARRDGSLSSRLEVLLSPEDDAEVRRITLSNHGLSPREIEVSSYSELVLAPGSLDLAHPAFSKLFVETSYESRLGALIATRRRRTPTEAPIWVAHLCVVEGHSIGELEFETERGRFIGRGHDIRHPIALLEDRPLSGTVGATLDPIFSIRRKLHIPAGSTARLSYWTMVASTRESLLDLVDKHKEVSAFERASMLAWTQAQVQLRHLGIDRYEASLFQQLAGCLLYADPLLRPSSSIIARGAASQRDLWPEGISGDRPIVLIRIADILDLNPIRQILRAQQYLKMKRVAFDLVILNEHLSSYAQDLQASLQSLVSGAGQHREEFGLGSVFILQNSQLSLETRLLLPAAARVVLDAALGNLVGQLNRFRERGPLPTPSLLPASLKLNSVVSSASLPKLEFYNGTGGFAENGREYEIILGPGQSTPAPWINVIANQHFGFQVSAEGSGYTWAENSRENKLTPWSNDPVSDRSGEAFYLRDEDTGKLWSPTASPIRQSTDTYVAKHGQGYSQFELKANGLEHELLQFVPLQGSVKISRLRLKNVSGRTRRLSVTGYAEWVLGVNRPANSPFVITELDQETGAVFAKNLWNSEYASRVAFFDMAGAQASVSGDRREFIGRNGTMARPLALAGKFSLAGKLGAGLDPCAALQAGFELRPNESKDILFFLGQSEDHQSARSCLQYFRHANVDGLLAEVKEHWEDLLGTVQVQTPDRSMDIMLNGWLLYQTVACRLLARSAFYQSSGAYGFRDQLQDSMALTIARPTITREQLLRAAGRQFETGDVQHWWLPQAGQGVRTRISDDSLWLAYVLIHYLDITGDYAVLDEQVSFLLGEELKAGEHDNFFQPSVTEETASLYEHCARGLERSFDFGEHGLPLIGTGDWNDGMNRVGELGRGESVWLGWFLYKNLLGLAPIALARGEQARAESWLAKAEILQISLEQEGWDGAWYRRGYFDDGSPLGSALSNECQIDSIAQSWSVLSGGADPARALEAMHSMKNALIRPSLRLALLFTPAFDKSSPDPGYVMAYPPGIRENGGQYTHAATWSVLAFAQLGDGNAAHSLFSLLNPINQTSSRANVRRYRVEPYVVAADVYSVSPHVGRGGWTWYTGAAGWLYQSGLQGILGFRLRGEYLELDPCIPEEWPSFTIKYKYKNSLYEISVLNPARVSRGIASATLDGEQLVLGAADKAVRIKLIPDSGEHRLEINLG